MLSRDGNHQYGRLVQSLHVKPFFEATTNNDYSKEAYGQSSLFFVAHSGLLQKYEESGTLNDKEQIHIALGQGVENVAQMVYNQLTNLEVLILEDTTLIFSFPFRLKEKIICHPFLVNSLKKLYVARSEAEGFTYCNLSAINSIWLLLFCPQVKEAALCFLTTIRDLELLRELSESFQGLSKVEKLALEINFIARDTDRKTWWSHSGESSLGYLGGNRKTEALYRMLSVTKGLQALEIHNGNAGRSSNPGDDTLPTLSCLSSLHRSFDTMRHLRLIRIGCNRDPISYPDFLCFKSLSLLSIDFSVVTALHFLLPSILLPSSLETVCSTFYEQPLEDSSANARLAQDEILADVIKIRSLPRLNQVVVPLQHINLDGKPINSSAERLESWARGRERFKNHEIFASGVRLREVLPGERSESSQIEVQLSSKC